MQKGLTIMLVFGSYGGFRIECGPFAYRICLGWVAFSIGPMDIEKVIDMLLEDIKELESRPTTEQC